MENETEPAWVARLPAIGDLETLYRVFAGSIADDDRAYEDSNTPSVLLTVGWSDETGEWSYQSGDNSFTGGAYGYPHWAVVAIDRPEDMNESREAGAAAFADEVLSQLSGLVAEYR